MAPALPRASFNRSELVRLLTELSPAEATDAKQTLGERLGQWLGWTDAISLAGVLNGSPPGGADPSGGGAAPARAVREAFTRVRGDLARAIATDPVFTRPDASAEPAHFRRHYLAHQRAMDNRIPPLRVNVRAALGSQSPALAQLAALDAVMDGALEVRERHLLSSLPGRMDQHFARLRQAGRDAAPADDGSRWLAVFCRDAQAVLQAELTLRLQPVEAMMDAMGAGAPAQTRHTEQTGQA